MAKSVFGLFTYDHVGKIFETAVAYQGCVLLKDIGDVPAGTDIECAGVDFRSESPVMCFAWSGKSYFVTLKTEVMRVELDACQQI